MTSSRPELLSIIFGGLLVWSTFVVGSRFGVRVGLASAVLVACSPIFLFQLVQPMSGVPAASLWMLAVAAATATKRRGSVIAGLASAAAVLMRPSLVPLAVPIGLFLLLRPERTWRDGLRAAATYAIAVAPGPLAVALIQQAFYGSPFASGYGSPNAVRYFSWMTAVHAPVWLLAVAAPFLLPGPLTTLFIAMVIVNVASSLPYAVFDDWWYLRFLFPTIPLVLILVVASIDSICRRVNASTAAPIVAQRFPPST